MEFFSGGPTFVASGQSVDLLLAGTGFDGTLTDANFAVLGSGVTVHAGGVRVDPNGSTVGNFKILRVTLDITAQQGLSLRGVSSSPKAPTRCRSPARLVIGPPTPTTTSASVVNSASGLGQWHGGNGAVSPERPAIRSTTFRTTRIWARIRLSATGEYESVRIASRRRWAESASPSTVCLRRYSLWMEPRSICRFRLRSFGKASTKVVVNYLGRSPVRPCPRFRC